MDEDRSQKTIWRRRIALMVFVAFVVGVPLTIVLRDDDDKPASVRPTADAPRLSAGVKDPGLKVGYRVPKGWKEKKAASAIQLTSNDRSVLVAIAAPAGASERDRVLEDSLASIRTGYNGVEIHPGSGKKVGGLDAKGAVVVARTKEGGKLRILVAAMKGRKRTYLVEVFTAAGAEPERIAEAQVALNSLRLRG